MVSGRATGERQREQLLRTMAGATFIIFFQAYMVAPIIPVLSNAFGVPVEGVGLIVPAYLIPYGISTLAYGLLADRLGIHRVMFTSLTAFAVLTLLTATAHSIEQLALWRLVTGIGASGVVPLALALVGRLYPYEQRGRPLGWLFGAMAGGMAFGSPLGAMIVPFVGWQGLFLVVGTAGAVLLLMLLPYRAIIAAAVQPVTGTLRDLFQGYKNLLGTPRGKRTYGYVLVNSIFHSGVFTWLGVYFDQRYGLGPVGIGLALLGYGVPGFVLGPLIGRAADAWGRARLIPIGLVVSALAGSVLMLHFPVGLAPVIAMVLSLGYDMTQPLFAGIVTSLGGERAGQAMGLNVFTLFVGFGLGSLIFGELIGPVLIILGLMWPGWIRLPLPSLGLKGKRPTTVLGAFALGVVFAVAVCPVCTPALVILLGAAVGIASPLFGAIMLLVFAIGRAIPIALGAWAAGWLENLSVLSKYQKGFEIAGAVTLIASGLYMLNAYYFWIPSLAI